MIIFGKSVTGIITVLLVWSSFTLTAQDTTLLQGKVTDALTGIPVPAASVFINNSTYVAIGDEKGAFILRHFPPPPFELTVTAIGYETALIKIAGKAGTPLLVRLKSKPVDLGEVTILGPEKDGWQKYGQLFLDDFIGYSPFAASCELLNREALQFRYDKEENKLRVWAKEPLKIRNKATGYLITYWLEDFERNFKTKKLYFKGYTLFTDLPSQKKKELERWASQRQSAYRGSLNHFMRSLYQHNPQEEGFEIRKLLRVSGTDYGRYVPVSTDTILYTDKDKLKAIFQAIFGQSTDQQTVMGTLISLLQWKSDSSKTESFKLIPPDTAQHKEYTFTKIPSDKERIIVRYFDFDREPPETKQDSLIRKNLVSFKTGGPIPDLPKARQQHSYDILYTGILNTDTLVKTQSPGTVQLHFSDYLHITYTREKEEPAYLKRQFPFKEVSPENQTSIISIVNPEGITVYPDGNFYLSYDLLTEKYWSYEKLDKLLPLDYRP